MRKTAFTWSILDARQHLSAKSNYADHVTAPVSGVVTGLQVKEGEFVNVNQNLVMVLPVSNLNNGNSVSSLEVELWAPSNAVGFLKLGTKVRLMYSAFPYQTFGVGLGSVKEISLAALLPIDLKVRSESKEEMYRVRVALERDFLTAYGREWKLLPGMRLSADLILEERTLLDWLLDPIMAMKKRTG